MYQAAGIQEIRWERRGESMKQTVSCKRCGKKIPYAELFKINAFFYLCPKTKAFVYLSPECFRCCENRFAEATETHPELKFLKGAAEEAKSAPLYWLKRI